MLLDVTIVNVALPSIQRGLQASFSGLQRVIDGYALTLDGALLAAGSLALPETGFRRPWKPRRMFPALGGVPAHSRPAACRSGAQLAGAGALASCRCGESIDSAAYSKSATANPTIQL